MNAESMLALAERCEAANWTQQGELLGDAWDAIAPGRGLTWARGIASSFSAMLDAGASLDAAMTLVPEGYDWSVDNFDGEYGKPSAWVHQRGSGRGIVSVTGATPALALTAAALRARAHAQGSKT